MLTIIVFVVCGFILLVAFNKTDGVILSRKVGEGPTSVAIVAGIAILVFTMLTNAIYVAIANSKFDTMSSAMSLPAGSPAGT